MMVSTSAQSDEDVDGTFEGGLKISPTAGHVWSKQETGPWFTMFSASFTERKIHSSTYSQHFHFMYNIILSIESGLKYQSLFNVQYEWRWVGINVLEVLLVSNADFYSARVIF